MEDVLRHVVLGTGDEPLDALEVPGPVGLLSRLRPAGADVGSGVRLGQRHRRRPLALDGALSEPLLGRRAHPPEGVGEGGTTRIHPDGRVGTEDQLGYGPRDGPRRKGPAKLRRQLKAVPLSVKERPVGLREGRRHPDGSGGWVEHRRVAVSFGKRLGDRAGGQLGHLVQDPPGGRLIQFGVGLGAQQILPPQHLKQVEFDIPQVALVVTHACLSLRDNPVRDNRLLASNLGDPTSK